MNLVPLLVEKVMNDIAGAIEIPGISFSWLEAVLNVL